MCKGASGDVSGTYWPCAPWQDGLLVLVGRAVVARRPRRRLATPTHLLLRANKAVYAEGEPLELTLEVVNRSPRPVTLQFRDSQRYDFLIRNAQGQEVWRWSAGQMFAQILGEETLAPDGENLTYRTVKQLPLMRGLYTIIGVVPAMGAQMSARLQVTIQ